MTLSIEQAFEAFVAKHQLTSTTSKYAAIEADFVKLVAEQRADIFKVIKTQRFYGNVARFLIGEFQKAPIQRRRDLVIKSRGLCSHKVISNALRNLVKRGVLVRAAYGQYVLKQGDVSMSEETNLSWENAQPFLYQGKRIRRASFDEGNYLDLKAGKYRLFHEERLQGTDLLNPDWSPSEDDSGASDWETYEPMFYSSDS